MKAAPKVNRPYESPLRAGQARSTRLALLEAARRLFEEQGYVATSIEQIAEAAGVSRATVFTSVGGKPVLLKAAYDVALVGDDEPVPMPQRPDALRAKAEPDPYKHLAMYAAILTQIQGRIARINEAIRGAAGADSEARALWETVQSERAIGAEHVIEIVEQKGGLRRGLDRREAIDIVWTLIEPGLYFQLVHQRAWKVERYQAWLADALHAQLLPSRRASLGKAKD
jgi:AcrR family transcriptional regulator